MTIDKATLEALIQLKEEHGIGSRQAWVHLKDRLEYEKLRKEVAVEVGKRGINYFPTVEEIARVCNAFTMVLDNAYYPLDIRLQKVLKKFLGVYFEIAGKNPDMPKSESVFETCEDVSNEKIPLKDTNGKLLKIVVDDDYILELQQLGFQYPSDRTTKIDNMEFNLSQQTDMEKILYGESIFYSPFIKEVYSSIKSGNLSLYVRALLGGTKNLHNGDMERQIALQYIKAIETDHIDIPSRIELALKILISARNSHKFDIDKLIEDGIIKKNGLHKLTEDGILRNRLSGIPIKQLDNEISMHEATMSAFLTYDEEKAVEYKRIYQPKYTRQDIQRPEKVIYKIMNGRATVNDVKDYIIGHNDYIIHAIQENERWLIKMLGGTPSAPPQPPK